MVINDRIITFFRVSKLQPSKAVGDISDITEGNKSIGTAIDFTGGDFTQVRVINLSEKLEEDLRCGVKRIRIPTKDDPMYDNLLSGMVTVEESQLLQYVEVI